jgi:hypothetical protein
MSWDKLKLGQPWFSSKQEDFDFVFILISRMVLGSNQSRNKLGFISLEVKSFRAQSFIFSLLCYIIGIQVP